MRLTICFRGIKGLLVLCVLSASAGALIAQLPEPTLEQRQQAERVRNEAALRDAEQRRAQLRRLREREYRGHLVPTLIYTDLESLYRRPTKNELKTLRPLDEDLVAYKSFLRRKNTGLVRFVPDAGCGDGTRTVSAADECVRYSMPGNGSSYSFRESSYRIRRLADLHYAKGDFSATGVMQHGILAGIGDVPLDQVTLGSAGVESIMKFVPVTTVSALEGGVERLRAGWSSGRFYYATQVKAIEGMTYVLRSIAYRGRADRALGGVAYNELDFDERLDLTVVFRIVRTHADGGVTIAWRELTRRPSPTLKRDQKDKAITPNKFEAAVFDRQR